MFVTGMSKAPAFSGISSAVVSKLTEGVTVPTAVQAETAVPIIVET
jgi:hypothetical protein